MQLSGVLWRLSRLRTRPGLQKAGKCDPPPQLYLAGGHGWSWQPIESSLRFLYKEASSGWTWRGRQHHTDVARVFFHYFQSRIYWKLIGTWIDKVERALQGSGPCLLPGRTAAKIAWHFWQTISFPSTKWDDCPHPCLLMFSRLEKSFSLKRLTLIPQYVAALTGLARLPYSWFLAVCGKIHGNDVGIALGKMW